MKLALLCAFAALAGCAGGQRASALSPEHFHSATVTEDDPLEFSTVISTEAAHRGGKVRGTITADPHLRAVIDRRSGTTRYEVRKAVRYWAPRRHFEAAQFLDAGELQRAPLALARHGADDCPDAEYGGLCIFAKDVAFHVDERVLRDLAARESADDVWSFRIKEAAGRDLTGAIVPAEAAGLLAAVDRYRASLPVAR